MVYYYGIMVLWLSNKLSSERLELVNASDINMVCNMSLPLFRNEVTISSAAVSH